MFQANVSDFGSLGAWLEPKTMGLNTRKSGLDCLGLKGALCCRLIYLVYGVLGFRVQD